MSKWVNRIDKLQQTALDLFANAEGVPFGFRLDDEELRWAGALEVLNGLVPDAAGQEVVLHFAARWYQSLLDWAQPHKARSTSSAPCRPSGAAPLPRSTRAPRARR